MAKKITGIIAIFMISICLTAAVSADVGLPFETYTISRDYREIASPPAYVPDEMFRAEELGTSGLISPSDMEVHEDELFILDAGSNRILVLDESFRLKREIEGFINDGKEDHFSSPEGLTISPAGELYIADTANSRIVRMDLYGELITVYDRPDISVLEDDYKYLPLKTGVDRGGRIYVIARGVNRGLIVLDENGSFVNFTGAPRVTYDPITLIWKTILPRSAAKYMLKFVPTEFSNLYLDKESFIYTTIKSNDTTTLYTAISSRSQTTAKVVQRFNATGNDVLRRFGDIPIVGDVNWDLPSVTSSGLLAPADMTEGASAFEDITVDESGCYYCIDSYRGRIFAYDNDGNLLYAFGSNARREGNVQLGVAIELFSDKIVVLDRLGAQIVTYSQTDYGKKIQEAALLFNSGKYQKSYEKWNEVARYNGNLTIAYIGIGKSAYRLGDQATAMTNLRKANEKEYYSKAFYARRSAVINDFFPAIFAGTVVSIVVLVLFLLGVFKRKLSPGKPEHAVVSGMKYSLYLIVHPFDGFWDLKNEKRGNAAAGSVIFALAVISYIFRRQYCSYLYSEYDPATFNIFTEILIIVLPVMLWVLANWSLTTLMSGKGNMKDIYIATTYSLTPMILLFIPVSLMTHVLSLEEQAYVSFFINLAFVWIALLIFFGTMITHQYAFSKSVITGVMIIAGMVIIIFIGILFYNLLQRMLTFIISSWQELTLHIFD